MDEGQVPIKLQLVALTSRTPASVLERGAGHTKRLFEVLGGLAVNLRLCGGIQHCLQSTEIDPHDTACHSQLGGGPPEDRQNIWAESLA